MFSRLRYILITGIILLSTFRLAGQLTMPDNVCVGETKRYNVDPNPVPGSTYTWRIDGEVQPGFTTIEFIHTWNSVGTYLLDVQELSADGCLGPVRSGQVFVNPQQVPTFAAVGPYCSGAAIPALPSTSNNGIHGTWAPAINNTETTAYTFIQDAGQCASAATLTITITDNIIPEFAAVGPYCSGAAIPALPSTSTNGIHGTWAPAISNTATTTYTFTPDAGQCASNATLSITIADNIVPEFAAVGPYCSGATIPALPATSTIGIHGTWAPAINNTATTTYTFTPDAGQCASTASLTIIITDNIVPEFAAVGPYCSGAAIPALPSTSANGITGTWAPAINNTATTTYTFTPDAGQCASTATLTITIADNIVPEFAAVGPYCSGAAIPALPVTSANGIHGTWAPAISNTATTTYTFTPDAGQCASTATLDIVITNSITPVFSQTGPLCQNSVAPVLPTTSMNGITGTWSPATINTAAVGTTTYTFMPDAGQCASTANLTVTIADNIVPEFAAVGPYCSGAAIPALPSTSANGITGTWAPAINNTATTTYTFTPDAGQCTSITTLTIEVTSSVTPTFAAIGPLCQNSVAPALPSTSNNGITGTWSPATISTAAVGTTTYTFTPDAGQCASTATLTITITDNIIPEFAAVGPYCSGAAIPALPSTSANGITGTWAPAINNTATTTYTFTPDAGQCASTATLDIVITNSITPVFSQTGPLCQNSVAPVLPTTSMNGITGTWSPATINTVTVGSTTYTFTPDAGHCASITTLTIEVTSSVTPIFAAIGPLCQNSVGPVLPTTSTNGITGTWSPATISTAAVGTTTYTFTPDAGQCASTASLTITITDNIVPEFAAVGPYCSGAAIPALPATSTNGIHGTWAPAISNTATTTYTFTPDAGQCASAATLTITITDNIVPEFAAVGPYCSGAAIPALPSTSANGFTGTWSPSVNNAVTTTYTFTPDAGQCASTATLTITITDNIVPEFAAVGPYCSGATIPALPVTSANGIHGTWAPAISNTATTTYTFTPDAGQCASAATMIVEVTTSIIPTFVAIGPLCQGSVAPALPSTSNNGITGTWSPAAISTATVGTTTFTFTPYAGQCASTVTLTITIADNIVPEFAAVRPYCSGAAIPALPVTSANGIHGTWAPAISNTATTTYTFTPDAGQCASITTLTIEVTSSITPTSAAVGPLCQNSVAPVLPTTSMNGITGTWSPATINTAAVGTTTYTFMPDAGQCASTATLTITITDNIVPEFAAVGPYCSGAAIPALPSTSINGIHGTWAPAISNTATTTYTFTPDAGQCASTATLNIEVTTSITPIFAAIGPLCQGSVAPALPSTSINGITGTWNPATMSTAAVGTTTYTFTPVTGQCASAATMNIEVTTSNTPTFVAIGPLCQGSVAPVLPSASTTGIRGTWSPASINTSAVGTSAYTFTPATGQCASPVTVNVVITNSITPVFSQPGPLCQGSVAPVLPVTSANGISGTWNPTLISTATAGTTTYTFTPAAGQCASTFAMGITITNTITPVFNQIGPLVLNSAAPVLPSASRNVPAISGTWSPSVIATGATGTRTYVFTPSAGQCAVTTSMDVTVTAPSVSLVKNQVSGPNPVTASGQVIIYQITLTNTGNTEISGITATENYPGTGSGTLGQPVESLSSDRILNRGETWRYSASYTATQADVDAGRPLMNTINIVTAEIPGPLTATASTPVGGIPSVSISKSAGEAGYSAVGNLIHYSIVVRNTGSFTLTNVNVADPLTGFNQTIALLNPGESRTFNTTHTVNQNDLNSGTIINTATASFTHSGRSYRESSSQTLHANQSPGLQLQKTALPASYSHTGEIIRYTITIRNNGNVTLSGIRVSDPFTGLNQTITTLQPGASQTISTTHTIDQADLNTGHVTNVATAEYTFSGSIHRVSDEATVSALQNPQLSIMKSSAETSFTAAGDVIHYTVTVTNTGNITMTNVLPSDPNAALNCTGAPFTLTPGASRTCTATHVITTAEVVSGHFSNTAAVSGSTSDGRRISATSNTVTVSLNNAAPRIICPSSVSVNTRLNSCDAIISSGLSATYSDPNNNIVALTWIMTGATSASSPATGMNNLSQYTFNRGVTTITYTVTDRPGLSSSCSFTVTVIDNVPPVIVCPGSQGRNTDTDGPGYTVTGTEFDPVAVTDNCAVTGLRNNINNSFSLSGASFPVGVTSVVWTASDASGNTTSCSFNVTVTDNVVPVVRCKDATIYLNLNTGKVTLTPAEIDNGSFDNTGIALMTVSTTDFDCTDIGTNNITLNVTDRFGNTGTCTSVVTVLFAVTPAASVSTSQQLICNDGTTDIRLINNIPNTSWTWSVGSSQWISGSLADNSGRLAQISQRLNNSDTLAHSITYSVVPTVYGMCALPEIPVTVWVNPEAQIRLNPGKSIICNGESTNITVRNPNTSVRGEWAFELTIIPDKDISGYSSDRVMNSGTVINDRLLNTDSVLHKIEYRFKPVINSENGQGCEGAERIITILVRPAISYRKNLSDYNGYNISCFGMSDGFVLINPFGGSTQLSFNWQGPGGFASTGGEVRKLAAGRYTVRITDENLCFVQDSVLLRSPEKLNMKIDPSISKDGAFNINCADEATGSIMLSPVNHVGAVNYLWSDGNRGAFRPNLGAGEYRVIITDANNCKVDSTVIMTEPEKLKTEFEVTLPYCPEKPDGEVRLNVTGGIEGTGYKYTWSDNSDSRNLTNVKAGIYEVTVGDMNGCSIKSAVPVNALHEICLIIPEAISPNNDLINDEWNIGNSDLYPNMEIWIYNRWGQLLWKSEQGYPQPWDGRSNGRVLPVDSYHYVIDLHNGMKPLMGTITIVK